MRKFYQLINVLSTHLQSSTIEIIICLNLIESIKTELKYLRSDEYFENFYKKTEIIASNFNISLSNDKKDRRI